MQLPLIVKWIGVMVFSGLLGGSVLMLWKGTLPPPFSNVRVGPVFSTALFVLGMTGLLVFGEPELLNVTLATLSGK
ncbi:MAG TPA: hypothetical protein VNT75_18835 [Symbiobacteriaceae bacterium]|nr:hypothetical protein [Symbiobacteriaceae bacterium]